MFGVSETHGLFITFYLIIFGDLCFTSFGLPLWLAGKESAYNSRDLGSIPGLGGCPGEGNSYTLQYSGLENSMNCIVHGIVKLQA